MIVQLTSLALKRAVTNQESWKRRWNLKMMILEMAYFQNILTKETRATEQMQWDYQCRVLLFHQQPLKMIELIIHILQRL